MTSSKTNAFEFLMSKKRKILDEDIADSVQNVKKSKAENSICVIQISDCENNDQQSKNYNYCHSIYPIISHIRQNSNDSSPVWNLPSIKLSNLRDPIDYLNLTIDVDKNFDRIRFECNDRAVEDQKHKQCNNIYLIRKLTSDETRDVIMKLRTMFRAKFPIRKYYQRLVSKKLEQESDFNINLWSNIFRPVCTADLLAVDPSVRGLDKWLQAWQNFNNDNPARMKIVNDRKSKKLKNKKNEKIFIDDTDYEKEAKRLKRSLNNWKVIIGPCGSSKTATLSALCDQYNIDILEWNASSFRTGRNLLQKFQEATKSYNIHSSNHFAAKNSKADCDKMSLILIKDFDLIFEDYDEGFLPALDTLIAKSKRPIVLISSSKNVADFEKRSIFQFLDNNNTDHLFIFERNSSENLRIFFQLLLLATERIYLSDFFLNTLIALFRNDIRGIFMQLEFWLKDNETLSTDSLTILNNLQSNFNLEWFWWKFNEDFCELENTEIDRHEFQQFCFVFDSFSISDLISTNQTQNCFQKNNKCQQNEMSLKPSTEMYSEYSELANEIIDFLAGSNRCRENFNYLQKIEKSFMYKQKQISASEIFEKALPEFQYRQHDLNDVVLLDCLPYLRQIYRAEYEQYCYASSANVNRKFNLHQRTYLRKFHIRYDDRRHQHNQDLLQFHLKCFQQQDFLL